MDQLHFWPRTQSYTFENNVLFTIKILTLIISKFPYLYYNLIINHFLNFVNSNLKKQIKKAEKNSAFYI